MNALNGRESSVVRIPASQYQADIAAAEERGRASVATVPAPVVPAASPTPTAPTAEQEEAMAQIKVLKAANAAAAAETEANKDPQVLAGKISAHVAAEKAKGRRISFIEAASEVTQAK